jgi:Transmembrane secretion effector
VTPATSSPRSTTWTPLLYTWFRWLWIASVVSNIGTWMQNVGAAWLMTELAPSALLVTLVQTATNLLGVLAGAAGDLFESAHTARAMQAMRTIRRRDGAIRWGLFEDTATPGRYLETFVVESWAEHLRQHDRVTISDREIEKRAFAFHHGAAAPKATHWIANE